MKDRCFIRLVLTFVVILTTVCAMLRAQSDESLVNFSFDQVDVRSFVKLVGDITGKKFVVADNVAGKITVVSPRVKKSNVYPLFVSILESVGCTVAEQEGISRVIQTFPRLTPTAPVIGPKEKTPESGMITKVLRPTYVSAMELRKLLESKVSGGKTGSIGAIDESNHLIVTDTADAVRQIEKIVSEVDQPGLSRMTELIPLKFAGAEDIASQLNEAVSEGETRAEQLRNRLPSVQGMSEQRKKSAVVVAAPHSNSLILVGSSAQIEELKRIIQMMDVDMPSGRGRLNAIFLKYMAADEAAKSINALLAKTTEKDSKTGISIRRIAVESNTANNALIVDSTVGDFEVVRKLVEQLDQMPQQVHIEVMIIEVSQTDSLDIGVEMAALDMPSKVGDVVLQGSSRLTDGADSLLNSIQSGVFPRGISVGVAQGTSVGSDGKITTGFPGAINIDALKKKGKVKIRSQTALEAQNNKEASVNIVNEIPVLKSTIQGGSGTSRDVIQNLDRIDVGIKLKLTPYIIPGGEVRMVLNPSIEAVIDSSTQFAPIIAKRDVSTTVTVQDGKTIVIAGLTREDKTKSVRKVPILGSIPVLGILFRRTSDANEKTNLLIFVTPRIVSDMNKAESVMKDWEKKTDLKANEK
ncbi:MAG: type II secretion system secretin GspD [Kiritimatiellae bacterium]|nr:type II secretion system secretin GspD [Kiritimatiellia bacterium]MDD5520218.1 type II secretion system secretin GspD [Kiritimatiellia bacterium]